MLKTECNTPTMERRLLAAARQLLHQRKGIRAVFEHDQWWILQQSEDTDRTYAVQDAEGPSTVDGFCLEEV